MFDERYCAGMTLGPAEISIDGLNELASVLALNGASGSDCASAVEKMRRELYGQRSERKVGNR